MESRGGKRSLAALVAGVGLAAAVGAWPSPARAALGYQAVAAADGVRFTVEMPNAPLTNTPIDGGGPSAQALITSAGQSQGFASSPYPGDNAVAMPGTLAGLGVPGIPPYPFYAASTYPQTAHADAGQAPLQLVSDSAESSSKASAAFGQSGDPAASSFSSTASAMRTGDDVVTATSGAVVEGLKIGPMVLGSVRSSAETVRGADGKLKRTSDLQVSGASVSGVSVVLAPGGLVVADQNVPLANEKLADALKQARLSVEYVPLQETADGIVSAGLRITSVQEVPGQGTATTVYRIGQAVTSVQSGAAGAVVGDLPIKDPAGLVAPPGGPNGVDGIAGTVPGSPGVGAGGPAGAPGGTTNLIPSEVAGMDQVAAAGSDRSVGTTDASGFYLLLVAAAAAVFGAVQILRLLGVKFRWTS